MNKNILITGGGRRLGRHLSINFAKIGYNVVIHYNQSEDNAIATRNEIIEFGGNCILIRADVRNKIEVFTAMNLAVEKFGKIDVLVNNAGVFPTKTEFSELSESLWDDTMNVNLRGEFYFSQAFARHFAEGRIINIGSIGGAEAWPGRIPYNVSKAAVIHLTRSLALELAPNFSVNCVAPGIIEIDERAEELISIPAGRIPFGRYGTADDVFDAVRFFAERTNYITGQVLFVDGGYNLARRM